MSPKQKTAGVHQVQFVTAMFPLVKLHAVILDLLSGVVSEKWEDVCQEIVGQWTQLLCRREGG
jgi:hypothetical protein